jgi:hypothetical protein
VAHIDPHAKVDVVDNLVFLCLEHHRQLDSGSITPQQVRRARSELYEGVENTSLQFTSDRPWRAYEEHVADLVRSSTIQRLGDHFGLRRGELRTGRSGISHELDLAVDFRIAGAQYLTVFEIKHRLAPLSMEEVMRFAAVVEDVAANKGVIVSSGGFSAAAIQLARAKGIGLLRVTEETSQLDDAAIPVDAAS